VSLAGLAGLASCGVRASAGADLSPQRLGQKVSALTELATYEYLYRDIVYIGEEARFLGIKHLDKQLLFAVDFRIRAGFDLSRRPPEVLPLAGGGVRVELPPPQVLTADAEEDSIRQYFVKEFGGRVSRLEYYDRISKHKQEAVDNAIADGILERAGENARIIVRNTLENIGIEPVFVVFVPSAEEDATAPEARGGS
jgi:hypothetical protein